MVMSKLESDLGKIVYNNWAFDKSCLQRVLGQDLQNKPRGENEDVVFQVQILLHHMMEAFDLSDEDELFDFIKSHTDFEYGIDFMQLQQMLVSVDRQMWGTEYAKKQRNRFLDTAYQAVQYLINKEYLPDAQPDELKNRAKDIYKRAIHKNASDASKRRWEQDELVMGAAFQFFKEEYEKHGTALLVNPATPGKKPTRRDIIAAILDKCTLEYPDGTTKFLGRERAIQLYRRFKKEVLDK